MTKIRKLKQNLVISEGKSLQPYDCLLYLTIKCNLKCPMCFQQNQNKNFRDLTLDDIKTIFDRTPIDSIFLIGGEIFIRKDIYDIINYFNSKNIKISFLSNGTMISEEGIDKLMQFENLDNIWFSLDGLESVHDQIRGKGAFKKVSSVIKSLAPHKKIHINCVILEENIDELESILDYVNELGVESISFQFKMIYTINQYMETIHDTERLGYKYLLYDDCVRENVDLNYMKKLQQIASKLVNKDSLTKVSFYPGVFLKNLEQYIDGSLRKNHKLICNDFVNSRLKIGPKGELLVCESMKYSPGNLIEKNLDELWNGDDMRYWRKSLCENNMLEMCTRCCGVEIN